MPTHCPTTAPHQCALDADTCTSPAAHAAPRAASPDFVGLEFQPGDYYGVRPYVLPAFLGFQTGIKVHWLFAGGVGCV